MCAHWAPDAVYWTHNNLLTLVALPPALPFVNPKQGKSRVQGFLTECTFWKVLICELTG